MGNLPLDAVTVEVVRAALNAAAERMRITMIKTAYNHIISESLDFGCAIFDADVQMIAQGIGLPVFQGHLGFPIEATVRDRGIEAFREGDIFIGINVPVLRAAAREFRSLPLEEVGSLLRSPILLAQRPALTSAISGVR